MAILRKRLMSTVVAGLMAVTLVAGGSNYVLRKIGSETSKHAAAGGNDVTRNVGQDEVSAGLLQTTGSEYRIIPGAVDPSDPAITVKNSVRVFVYASIFDLTEEYVRYAIEDGWKPLSGYTGVYYQVAEPLPDSNGAPTTQRFPILKDDAVHYEASLTNDDMTDSDGSTKNGLTLSYAGFSIVADPFLTDDAGNPVEEAVAAYQAFENAPVSCCTVRSIWDETTLKSMLDKAELTDTVHMTMEQDVTLLLDKNNHAPAPRSSLILDGQGHTLTVPGHISERAAISVSNVRSANRLPELTLSFKDITLNASKTTYGMRFYNNNVTNLSLDNTTVLGGETALFLNSSRVTLQAENSTIESEKSGIAVNASGSEITLINCHITGGKKGNAPFTIGEPGKNTTIRLINCTVDAQNTAASHFAVSGNHVTIISENTVYLTNGSVTEPIVTYGTDDARSTASVSFTAS